MTWKFTGQYAVGYADLAYLDPDADISVDSPPFDEHLVGRVFYPTHKRKAGGVSRWLPWGRRRGDPWLPGSQYSKGMGKFLFFRSTGVLSVLGQYFVSSLSYITGRLQTLDLMPGAPLATPSPEDLPAASGSFLHPVVVFSHGLGGHRAMYSVIAGELASQGFIVLALEHADGTASCCHLAGPGSGSWRFYKGLGGEAGQVQKVRDRVAEMKTARRVLQALDAGKPLPGLSLSHGFDPATFLEGRLDLDCLAAMGHSYGGATVTALVSEDPGWGAAIALDPWWPALPPETPALTRFKTQVPLMLQPSHDWSVPNAWGQLSCDGERQAAVLQAARKAGGGALRLVLAGSSHNTYADALPLFGNQMGWLLEKLGLSARLDPVLGVYLSITASLAFLSTHLPLSAAQRAVQDWAPSQAGGMLQRVRARDAADRGQAGGLLSKGVPGKGLLDTVSDWLLNRSIRSAVGRPPRRSPASKTDASKTNGSVAENGREVEAELSGDIGSAVEAMEAMLPSAEPASGLHPHAPSRRTDSLDLAAGLAQECERQAAAQQQQRAGSKARLTPEQLRALLDSVGQGHSETVTAEEVVQLEALLGKEHIFAIDA